MIFEDRVRALAHLRYSDQQTRFIVTIALHGGFCLRRHYTTFACVTYGAGVRWFLDGLVERGLARRLDFRRDRGHVYQLTHSAIYDAIRQSDNRNRRATSPALIARKLMVLEYVLGRTDGTWLAAEDEKVELFTNQLGLPHLALPHRVFHSQRGQSPTTRYFLEKLPIHVEAESRRITFTLLATTTSARPVEAFFESHRGLLEHLPTWGLVVIAPPHISVLPARQAFARCVEPPVTAASFEAFVLPMSYDRFGSFAGVV